MKTIDLDNRDTKLSIDTYQTFNGDSFVEMEIENLCEQHNDDTLTYDDFDWTYDHKAIVNDLALSSIATIMSKLPDNTIVKNIELLTTESPKFYNFTTDSYVARYTVDYDLLGKYIADNIDAFKDYLDGKLINDDSEKERWYLSFYLDNEIKEDDYNQSMWEQETDIYYENVDIELIKKHDLPTYN